MDTEEYLKTIKEKTEDMRRCMTIRNKFERWNEGFIPLDDMSIDQLCEYYQSTKEILNKQLTGGVRLSTWSSTGDGGSNPPTSTI